LYDLDHQACYSFAQFLHDACWTAIELLLFLCQLRHILYWQRRKGRSFAS
jgi:hypothetical protein